MSFREEEREGKEADLRREMAEKDKLHRETVERLQIQVRGDFSVLYGSALVSLPFPCSHCLSLLISDSTARGERAWRREEEPLSGHFCHR